VIGKSIGSPFDLQFSVTLPPLMLQCSSPLVAADGLVISFMLNILVDQSCVIGLHHISPFKMPCSPVSSCKGKFK
jgi:hypothetical protein